MKNKEDHCNADGASQGLPTLIRTKEQLQEANMFVACRKVFTEEEDADENDWIAVIFGSFNIIVDFHRTFAPPALKAFSFEATVLGVKSTPAPV